MIAPEFPAQIEWLNATSKLYINDFRGKFLLLDFWTHCSISCMHAISELKRLEKKHPELVIVEVHSAKFHNERAKDSIKKAVIRYGIEHPVAIDNDFLIWRTYGIRSWPSIILIGPNGQIIGKASGEKIFEKLDAVVRALVKRQWNSGILSTDRSRFIAPISKPRETFLSFPGKLASDPASKRLFISDSNHNRVMASSPEGEVQQIIGSGREGAQDGTFEEAEFVRPQGLAFDEKENCLYIADTENHLIRRASFDDGRVLTVSGSGNLGGLRQSGGTGKDVSLNFPWDLEVLEGSLYAAMAGSHQIWKMDLETCCAEPYAGSGRKGIADGSLRDADLAQPTGLTTDGKAIYLADSDSSPIRKIEGGEGATLIGMGLCDFGDRDGPLKQAKLQHPTGVLFHDGRLYVADAYNHKIKSADMTAKTISTVAGSDMNCRRNGDALQSGLNEPNDIAYLEGMFYIADTNNHQIRIYDPKRDRVSSLDLRCQ